MFERTPPALYICPSKFSRHLQVYCRGYQLVSVTAVLALADGTIFRGQSIGAKGNTTGEVVFNTALTGYQEILTDPSYARQIVTLTVPHIGNTGTTPEDLEAAQIYPAGLVIRDLPLLRSNWRSNESLTEFLERGKVVAIAGIDTRKLTRILREKGAQAGCIMTGEKVDEAAAIKLARKFPGLKGMDLAKVVTAKRSFQWNEGSVWPENLRAPDPLAPAHARRRLRFRCQTQHPARPLRLRLSRDRSARADQRGRGHCAESRRCVSLQRSRRSGAVRLRNQCHSQDPRNGSAGVWHLPGSPDTGARRAAPRPSR